MESHDLVVPPTEGDGHSAGAVPSAAPAPFTAAEFEALIGSVWSLADDDPTRFDELLHAALVFLGRIALDPARPTWFDQDRAAVLLRAMEQRALWGPDHPVRQP